MPTFFSVQELPVHLGNYQVNFFLSPVHELLELIIIWYICNIRGYFINAVKQKLCILHVMAVISTRMLVVYALNLFCSIIVASSCNQSLKRLSAEISFFISVQSKMEILCQQEDFEFCRVFNPYSIYVPTSRSNFISMEANPVACL